MSGPGLLEPGPSIAGVSWWLMVEPGCSLVTGPRN